MMKILVLNSGSSSQKAALYEIDEVLPENPPPPLWQGKIEWGNRDSKIEVRLRGGTIRSKSSQSVSHQKASSELFDTLLRGDSRAISSPSEITAVGHRIVHGGSEYLRPTVVTSEVRASLAQLSAIAPLHNRAELEGIELAQKLLGSATQIAVFDTAFHSQMPPPSFVYPGPYEWLSHGIRRYGFHGINHQYCAERVAQLLGKSLISLRIVTCHLGNGCSLAAIRNGRSVDTTMGFTPLEGLMMGTRSGSVDPGILTFLMRQKGLDASELDELLNTKSGLLGVSGISSDMREILNAMRQGHERARLAFEIFVHHLRRGIGAMIGVLGDLDALVFTAGIGENSPEVRSAACETFEWIGLKLDAERNARPSEDQQISASDSMVPIFVIRAQEDWAIAQQCWRVLKANPLSGSSTLAGR